MGPVLRKESHMALDPYAQDIGDTLAQVNLVRTAMGYSPLHELPNANRGQPAACLYYRALADCGAKKVYGDRISFSSERQAEMVADIWGKIGRASCRERG